MPDSGKQRSELQEVGALEGTIPASQGRELLLSIMDRANDISGAPDALGVIHGMLDLMIEVAQADSANFLQFDPSSDELVFTAVRGDVDSQHLVGLRLNRQLVLPEIQIHGSQPVVIGDLASEPYWLRTVDSTGVIRKRNVINLPVTVEQKILGVVQIFDFQQAELDLLLILGKRLAVEINHRLELETTRQSKERFVMLVDMLGEVAGILDRNRLLHLITENASRLVDAERSSIFLVDPETNEMIYQVAYRSPDQHSPPSRTTDPLSQVSGLQEPAGDKSGGRPSSAYSQDREFTYFNRLAITVPLRSEPLAKDHSVDRNRVLGGLMAHNKHKALFQEEDALLMQILANQASTFLQVAEMYESAGDLFLGAIKALVAAIDAKDPYTQGHSLRVSEYAVQMSYELGLGASLVNDVRIGSLLHDIGKIGIPDSILLKAGKLTPEEYEIIKKHPTTGVNILSQVELLKPVLPAIAEHHERLDGSGYPARMTDKRISLMGRVVAVADVFDAMRSDRPYRPAFSEAEVLSYLKENTGILFDQAAVQALDNILARADKTSQN